MNNGGWRKARLGTIERKTGFELNASLVDGLGFGEPFLHAQEAAEALERVDYAGSILAGFVAIEGNAVVAFGFAIAALVESYVGEEPVCEGDIEIRWRVGPFDERERFREADIGFGDAAEPDLHVGGGEERPAKTAFTEYAVGSGDFDSLVEGVLGHVEVAVEQRGASLAHGAPPIASLGAGAVGEISEEDRQSEPKEIGVVGERGWGFRGK